MSLADSILMSEHAHQTMAPKSQVIQSLQPFLLHACNCKWLSCTCASVSRQTTSVAPCIASCRCRWQPLNPPTPVHHLSGARGSPLFQWSSRVSRFLTAAYTPSCSVQSLASCLRAVPDEPGANLRLDITCRQQNMDQSVTTNMAQRLRLQQVSHLVTRMLPITNTR